MARAFKLDFMPILSAAVLAIMGFIVLLVRSAPFRTPFFTRELFTAIGTFLGAAQDFFHECWEKSRCFIGLSFLVKVTKEEKAFYF